MGARFREITTGRYGPVRAVPPEVVIEVAFDTIQKAPATNPASPCASRIVRLRPDKSPADIATLEEVQATLRQNYINPDIVTAQARTISPSTVQLAAREVSEPVSKQPTASGSGRDEKARRPRSTIVAGAGKEGIAC